MKETINNGVENAAAMRSSWVLPITVGSACRVSPVTKSSLISGRPYPFPARKLTSRLINHDTYKYDSSCLKDMSISEIFEIAENRGKFIKVDHQSMDHLPKRITVSKSVTRLDTSLSDQTVTRQMDQSVNASADMDNEKFFENLTKKMITEQFMPPDGSNRLRRLCSWNKENSDISTTIKRRRVSRMNKRSIPSTAPFVMQSMSAQRSTILPGVLGMESQCKDSRSLRLDRGVRQCDTTAGLILGDVELKQSTSQLPDYYLSAQAKSFNKRRFCRNCSANACVSTGSWKSVKPCHDFCTNKTNDTAKCTMSQTSYVPEYSNSHWRNRSLSTIEECAEFSASGTSAVVDIIATDFDAATSKQCCSIYNCR